MADYTPTRVFQYTSTLGTGNLSVDGAAVYPSFFTVDEMAFSAGDTGVLMLQEGDDVEFSGYTVVQVSPFEVSRDSVLASRISGVAGTSKMNLGGTATVQFVIYGSDYDKRASFDYAAPASPTESGGNLTLDSDNGQVLVFEHTLSGDAEVQVPTNMKDGSTVYLVCDANGHTLSWATGTGFYAASAAVASITDRGWFAITRLGSQYHVAVAASAIGAL